MLRHIFTGLCLTLCLLVAAPGKVVQPASPMEGEAPRISGQVVVPSPRAEPAATDQTFDCASVTEIPQSECEALVALYNSTNGANWYVKTGWLQTATPCSWYGVTCTAGHVSELALGDNWLAGPLPPELGNLTVLVRLSLWGNPLGGTIPPTLGCLTNLQFLNLSATGLSGTIPPELGNLTALRILGLSGTSLSGAIPAELGNLNGLRWLHLNDNRLSGPIPPELGKLATLEYLNLSENQLSGPIPPELGKLTNLGDLYLNDNYLSGPIPPELGNLTNIRVRPECYYAATAGIFSALPPIHGYPNLVGNRVNGTTLPELSKLTRLGDLYLNDNQLSGPIPPELGNLADIRPPRWSAEQGAGILRPPPSCGYLDLSGNLLSGTIPLELSRLDWAAGVNLGCNQLVGPLPLVVGRVIRWGSVDYNMLSGYDPNVYPYWYWHLTQTVPPTNVRAVSNEGLVTLTWTPIPYTKHGGFYEISYATAPEGPYVVYGWTADKAVSSYIVDRLRYDVIYYFRIRTFSEAHFNYVGTEPCAQQSALASDYSEVVSTGGATPTPSPTLTVVVTATVTPTATPSATPTPTVTATATPTPVRLWLPLVGR